jgi:RNA ligase
MADECLDRGLTPIFEWCSRQQRIVVDYPEDRLVLIAIRDNVTGEYASYPEMQEWADRYGIELVREYPGTVSNMEALLSETHDLTGQEGWIIRFDDGHMLKLKGAEYVIIHKAKDKILRENGVIELLLDEKLDDIKPNLPEDDRRRLEDFEGDFWHGVASSAQMWGDLNNCCRRLYGNDRKGFALADGTKDIDQHLRSAIFKAWDVTDFDWRVAVVDVIRKNISTQTKVDNVRHLFGARWNYGSNTGDE